MRSQDSDKKRGKDSENRNSNTWMTTFSDLCTLLLTFFVLLFSMSSMDAQKLKIAFQNFDASSGFLSFREYREISRPMEVMINGIHKLLGEKVVLGKDPKTVRSDMDTKGLENLGNFLIIQPLKDGIKLVFGERLLFAPGSTEIREEVVPVLNKIARFISLSGYQAYIDGHTDNIPTQTETYSSNEELSIARAFNIRDYLLSFENIPPEYVALTGYGDLKPTASNDLPEGRQENRKVDIVLKNKKYF